MNMTRRLALAVALALFAGLGMDPGQARADTAAQSTCGLEWKGHKEFAPGESVTNCHGDRFRYQADGRAVITDPAGQVQWQTPAVPAGRTAGRLVFRGDAAEDGRLVALDRNGAQYWSNNDGTISSGAPGLAPGQKVLSFKDDGTLVIFTGYRWPMWTALRAKCDAFEWIQAKQFVPGEYYTNCRGEILTFIDGNVIIYDKRHQPAWGAGSNNSLYVPGANARLAFQGGPGGDGKLVVYGHTGIPSWATDAAPGGKLSFGRDGALAVFSAAGWPHWTSTRTVCEMMQWNTFTQFKPEEYVTSCHGEVLKFHAGNVVIWDRDHQVVWAAGSNNSSYVPGPNARLVFQGGPGGDGNLVVYGHTGIPSWATNVAAPGGKLSFGEDGNLAVFAGSGWPAWTSRRTDCQNVKLSGRKEIRPGEYFATCNGEVLLFQTAGNLVLFDDAHQPVWASGNQQLAPGGKVVFEGGSGGDGNLHVVTAGGQDVWSSNLPGAEAGGSFELTSGGGMIVSDSEGEQIGASADAELKKMIQDLKAARERLDQICRDTPMDDCDQAKFGVDMAIKEYESFREDIKNVNELVHVTKEDCKKVAKWAGHTALVIVALAWKRVPGMPDIWKSRYAKGASANGFALARMLWKCVDWDEVLRKADEAWQLQIDICKRNPLACPMINSFDPGMQEPGGALIWVSDQIVWIDIVEVEGTVTVGYELELPYAESPGYFDWTWVDAPCCGGGGEADVLDGYYYWDEVLGYAMDAA